MPKVDARWIFSRHPVPPDAKVSLSLSTAGGAEKGRKDHVERFVARYLTPHFSLHLSTRDEQTEERFAWVLSGVALRARSTIMMKTYTPSQLLFLIASA
jgi:hypothetical protein